MPFSTSFLFPIPSRPGGYLSQPSPAQPCPLIGGPRPQDSVLLPCAHPTASQPASQPSILRARLIHLTRSIRRYVPNPAQPTGATTVRGRGDPRTPYDDGPGPPQTRHGFGHRAPPGPNLQPAVRGEGGVQLGSSMEDNGRGLLDGFLEPCYLV